MRPPAVAVLLGSCALALAGCLPNERLNEQCRWVEPVTSLPPAGDTGRLRHLAEDVRVADWLAIRFADVSGPRRADARWARDMERCRARSLAEVRRRHGAGAAELRTAHRARVFWVDLLAVYLPLAVVMVFAARRLARRILAGADADDLPVAAVILAVWTPLAAGFGVGATQMWAWLVESARVRDGHISYRLADVPVFTRAGGWLTWQVGVVLFLVAVASVVLRSRGAPVPGPRRRT